MNVIVVVVTYNRLELLKRNISCLRQNKPIAAIIVVDNGSTDGTADWLNAQTDLHVIHQENVGGSGGFYSGIDAAYRQSADWIWCMDDDVFPRPDCLRQLLTEARDSTIGILAPRRLMDGQIFCHDFKGYNLTNPFVSMYKQRLHNVEVNSPVDIAGTAFEGPLIRREVVKRIGLPNKDMFIFCDDTDYCIRTIHAGFRIRYVPTALMDKQKFFSNDNWAQRNQKKKWKRFYQVRNSAYLNHHYGKNWSVRYLRSFINVLGYLIIALLTFPFSKAWQFRDVAHLWRAYKDGIIERLGIIKLNNK